MGFLHDGQLSLVRRARAENGCVVVSCFTDPGSFSTLDEFSPVPRDEARDLALLESAEADRVSPRGHRSTRRQHDPCFGGRPDAAARGASRPGHLDGLTTVMMKLIQLVGPARIYLGQKHAQQVVILRRMMQDLFMNADS